MTNQEINEAVARKLGNDLRVYNKVDVYKKQPNGNYILTQIPAYCTSISAAWEIVENVAKKPKMVFRMSMDEAGVGVSFSKWGKHIADTVELYSEAADTAPMAIALCFLKLEDTK